MSSAAAGTRGRAAARPGGAEPSRRSRRREHPSGHLPRAGWLSLGGTTAGFLVLCWLLRRFVTDDAWITIRYADNLADGHGFVWNPGGPRVEGFSNPLLVVMEALGRLAGVSGVDVARGVGVTAGVGVLVLIHRLAPLVVGAVATRIGLVLTALYPPLVLWSMGGLETAAATLALTAGVLPLAKPAPGRRDAVLAGAAFAVLAWLRPEGIAIAVAVVLTAEAPGLLRRSRAAGERLAIAVGLPLLAQAVLEASRLAIYGHLIANSVIYKSGRGGAWEVASRFCHQAWPILALGAGGLLVARGRQRVLAVAPVVYLIGSYGTVASVDSFSRFFMPIWPLWALLAALAVATGSRWWGSRPAAAGVAGVAGAALVAPVFAVLPSNIRAVSAFSRSYAACPARARARAADWLRVHTAPDAAFSISDAGLAPARARRTVVDQFFLNDPLIQRTGWLGARRRVRLIYQRRPDVLALRSSSPQRFRPKYPTDGALARRVARHRYHLAYVARGDGQGCRYALWLYRAGSRSRSHSSRTE